MSSYFAEERNNTFKWSQFLLVCFYSKFIAEQCFVSCDSLAGLRTISFRFSFAFQQSYLPFCQTNLTDLNGT